MLFVNCQSEFVIGLAPPLSSTYILCRLHVFTRKKTNNFAYLYVIF